MKLPATASGLFGKEELRFLLRPLSPHTSEGLAGCSPVYIFQSGWSRQCLQSLKMNSSKGRFLSQSPSPAKENGKHERRKIRTTYLRGPQEMICFVLGDFISLTPWMGWWSSRFRLIPGPGSAHSVIVRIIFHAPLQGGFNHKKGDGPMNALSQDELKTLMGKHQGLCVSIFMPTFRTGVESQQNQIRFRNLLRSAEEKLLAAGLRSQEVKELLEPAQALPGNVLFWRRQSDGLALFLCADLFRCFCLPEAFRRAHRRRRPFSHQTPSAGPERRQAVLYPGPQPERGPAPGRDGAERSGK